MSTLLLKTPAICLNLRPFSKTSQMVTWLTPDHGLITTPIKGAQRVKSGFVGRYDIGYTCELVFYARERNGIHHIRECSPLILRERLRSNWRAAMAAAYCCDLTLRTARPALANPTLFGKLSETLNALETHPGHAIALTLLHFEVSLLNTLGLSPDFRVCPHCAPSPRAIFSIEEGRICCDHRPSRLRKPLTVTLHRDIPDLYERFAEAPVADILREAAASDRRDDLGRPEPFPGIFGLRRFLGIFFTSHLDLLPGPRRTALDLLIG